MTVLDNIIDASTNSSVPVTDLLRMVKIAAHRVGASDIRTWVAHELNGYADDAPLPPYRVLHTNVQGTFAGPMQSFRHVTLTIRPNSLDPWWDVEMKQPLMELQALSESENDASREWSAAAVREYHDSEMFRFEYEILYTACNLITPQSLRGVLDVIRSKALDFALELQSAAPDAGSFGGPTVASEPQLAGVVFHVTNNIFGDGANVGTGTGIRQRSSINKGDDESLRREVEALGLSSDHAQQFVAAVSEEKSMDKPKVKRFLEQVRTGSIAVAGGVAAEAVAGSLIELAKAFLGL
ncbi:hypothetical protein AB0N61_15280 [Microbacterium sp. NPDC089320]|uniref:AbiTii domain-containing protein n=1 Tax=Microbacterium sp. NPDC089320 TaxID=3155182 RepID=UPI00343F41FA